MAEYRPVPDERIDDVRAATQYAFSPAEPLESDGAVENRSERDRMGARRGLFADNGALVSTCKHYWHTMSVRGDDHPVAGLAGVATPPEHRRQGYVGEMIAESLAEYRERGQSFAALWPFDFGFYRQFGWARAGTHARYECAPSALRTVADTTGSDGTFRRLDTEAADSRADDSGSAVADSPTIETIKGLDAVLDAHNEPFELTMRRTEAWWRYRVFEGYGQDPYVYGWERDGDLRGYVVYTVDEDDGETTLETADLAYADREAWVGLLEFLAGHDSQVERVRFHDAPSTWLLDVVDDPEAIDCEFFPGPMVRIVDVPTALERLSYPANVEGEFTLSVTDSTADWNDRTFAVAVEDGAATCQPADGGTDDGSDGPAGDEADVSADINTLSQLCVGHCSVERAAFAGGLSVESEDGETEALLDALFPSGDVFLREFF